MMFLVPKENFKSWIFSASVLVQSIAEDGAINCMTTLHSVLAFQTLWNRLQGLVQSIACLSCSLFEFSVIEKSIAGDDAINCMSLFNTAFTFCLQCNRLQSLVQSIAYWTSLKNNIVMGHPSTYLFMQAFFLLMTPLHEKIVSLQRCASHVYILLNFEIQERTTTSDNIKILVFFQIILLTHFLISQFQLLIFKPRFSEELYFL